MKRPIITPANGPNSAATTAVAMESKKSGNPKAVFIQFSSPFSITPRIMDTVTNQAGFDKIRPLNENSILPLVLKLHFKLYYAQNKNKFNFSG